jgi:hypothetical protein
MGIGVPTSPLSHAAGEQLRSQTIEIDALALKVCRSETDAIREVRFQNFYSWENIINWLSLVRNPPKYSGTGETV